MATVSMGEASPSPRLTTITARVLLDHERMGFLPRVFGLRHMLLGENAVYNTMRRLCDQYGGGFWDFVDLSNGGFYMRPRTDETLRLFVDGNGFDGEVSADAAGVIATLFAINALTFSGADHLYDRYYQLLDFAGEHPEARKILRAID